MHYDVIIIGAGPAGMMAAIRAAESGAKAALFEKNKQLGRKLILSGQGRCNLTNVNDLADSLKCFSKTGNFLRDAFAGFFNRELMEFFEKRGVSLKVERQNRVFPESDKAYDILEALQQELKRLNVKVFCSAPAYNILVENGSVSGVLLEDRETIKTKKVILATGGVSYQDTGSSGDGLKIARKAGHKITDLRAGLVPLVTGENWVKDLQGLALKNIRFFVYADGKERFESDIGELMFTHFGISGPLILNLSSEISDFLHDKKEVAVYIDLKPALSQSVLEKRLLEDIRINGRMDLKNMLRDYLPQRLVEAFMHLLSLDEKIPANQLSKEGRTGLIRLFKKLPVKIERTLHIEEAMVTKGGVSVKEINPKTMESRLIKGLYFAGEIIDVDAVTGGYNLQAAFSTGYLAGESAARSLR